MVKLQSNPHRSWPCSCRAGASSSTRPPGPPRRRAARLPCRRCRGSQAPSSLFGCTLRAQSFRLPASRLLACPCISQSAPARALGPCSWRQKAGSFAEKQHNGSQAPSLATAPAAAGRTSRCRPSTPSGAHSYSPEKDP